MILGLKTGVIEKIVGQAVDAVLPPRCIVSGELVEKQGMMAPESWRALNFISDPYCQCCGYPFDFEVESKVLCAVCLQDKPLFETARAALVYDDASRHMILKFKHADQTHAVYAFLPWLERVGAAMLAKADYIIPVPLHRTRLLKRRYNQAALMARALTARTGVTDLLDALQRRRATPIQGYLNYSERRKNVKNAFTVNLKHGLKLKGKTVVLVDDVYTTGATVDECTKALLKAGVAAVHILTIARVVKPGIGN